MALVVDTGPLLAAMDRSDPAHANCRKLLEGTEERIVVPAPVLAEMDYWIRKSLHVGALTALLEQIDDGGFLVADLEPSDYRRVREICEQYADSNVGFVDAAVLAIVERLNEPKLATLDHRHFAMMRPRHLDSLTLLPE